MSIILISDLHLEEHRFTITRIFFDFLSSLPDHQTKALYILGDLFESWIGDDDLTPFHLSVIKALKNVTARGLPIFIMHGNRDFLLGKCFMQQAGCTLLPDYEVINMYGEPTLLIHGDTLCTEDTKYLKFRKRARNKLLQKLFLWKSLEKRRAIAKQYRQGSAMHIKTLTPEIMDVTQEAVESTMSKYGVQNLIHGHTHRPAVHNFLLQDKPAKRTVLGAWEEAGDALFCYPDGRQERVILTS